MFVGFVFGKLIHELNYEMSSVTIASSLLCVQVCAYHHSALGLGSEWLPHSHHLLMRFTGGADNLHALALDRVGCGHAHICTNTHPHTHTNTGVKPFNQTQ